MRITKLTQVYFSPTGTTEKIVSSITQWLKLGKARDINLTTQQARDNFSIELDENELLIIGVPVYAGRVPDFLIPILRRLKGTNQPVVLVSVYGNVGEGKALIQLKDLLEKRGLKTIGAASFVGEHSYSSKEFKIGHGRPDEYDFSKAKEFSEKIINKLNKYANSENIPKLELNMSKTIFSRIIDILPFPQYGAKKFIEKPELNHDNCNNCKACVDLCPVRAINKQTLIIDERLCIRCMSCVKKCPNGARTLEYKRSILLKSFFRLNRSQKRKEPNIYV